MDTTTQTTTNPGTMDSQMELPEIGELNQPLYSTGLVDHIDHDAGDLAQLVEGIGKFSSIF